MGGAGRVFYPSAARSCGGRTIWSSIWPIGGDDHCGTPHHQVANWHAGDEQRLSPPVQLAKEIATIDQLSGGRVELGLGAGFLKAEYEPLGLAFDPPGVRVTRLQESMRLLRQLFTGEPVTFTGGHYSVKDFASFPVPTQGDQLPILIAGSGDRMLSLAAWEADIVGLQTVSTTSGTVVADPQNWLAETVHRKVDLIQKVAGTRFDHLEINSTVTIVPGADREASARQVITDREWSHISPETILQMPAFLTGTPNDMADQIRSCRDRFGLTYLVVSQNQAQLLANIMPLLV